MKMDKIAKERIQELEAQILDLHVIVDLQHEEILEKNALLKSLKGQLALLRTDRRVEVA